LVFAAVAAAAPLLIFASVSAVDLAASTPVVLTAISTVSRVSAMALKPHLCELSILPQLD
jgi:hypothetical protein